MVYWICAVPEEALAVYVPFVCPEPGVAIVTEECRKINPAIEVLPWEYNVDFRPNQAEIKAYGTAQLPLGSIPLLTFENGKAFDRDGEKGLIERLRN